MSRTVAIVEDEPAIRANYAEALRRHGYAVQPHASRAEAQAAFALKLPDLVIIDVGLHTGTMSFEEMDRNFDGRRH